MEELKIGNFDDTDNQSAISAHREETNTLRLDKLNNRVTIILIIIPIIIAAILIFGYLDMQETVIDINKEKQNKVLEITQQFGERANAFDVQISKINLMLEKTLPAMEKKIKKLEKSLAKLSSRKADKKMVKKDIAQYKTLLTQIEQTGKNNQTTINESKTKFETKIANINQKLNTEFNKMEEYETSVATTLKNLSILEKKFNEFKKNGLTNKTLVAKLDRMNKTFNAKLDNLEQKIVESSKQSKPTPAPKKTTPKQAVSPKPTKDKPIVEETLME
jgi:chromosome segregation ATPase